MNWGFSLIRPVVGRAQHEHMSAIPVKTAIPILPTVLAGVGAQLVDDLVYIVFPPAAVVAPLSGLLAVLLTAVGARIVTHNLEGPAIAWTGLAAGAISAGFGLVITGLGWLMVVIAGLTVAAGVAGATLGRNIPLRLNS